MAATSRPALIVLALGLALLLVFPALADRYYLQLVTKIMVIAIFAISLDLLVGSAGLISLGHAAFFGLAGYVLALAQRDLDLVALWTTLPLALAVTAAAAAVIGWLSVRTSGVYFIMITLAFAQMAYYAVFSLKLMGGGDGLNLARRSTLGLGIDLKSDLAFYYVALAVFAATLLFLHRLINAELGRALQGVRDNETRMEALGFPAYRIKLAAFVLAGAIAGLGGALLANLNGLVSPSLLHWTQSGALMIMVIVGGAGRFLGGALGAAALLLIEELLRDVTIHWQLGVGAILLAIVLFAPDGLAGLRRRLQP